jgi:hypothetical protein
MGGLASLWGLLAVLQGAAGLDLEKFRELNPPFSQSLPLHSEHYLSFVLFLATGWLTLMAMVWPAWEERQSDYDEMTLV